MLLLGPVALKLASTCYRFLRYYGGRSDYVSLGPPAVLMRFVVAPILVISTLVLFGSGVVLLARPEPGAVLTLHKASFLIWFGAMTIHVLSYALRVGRQLLAEKASQVDGRWYRIGVALLAIGAGVGTAVMTYSLVNPWFHGLTH